MMVLKNIFLKYYVCTYVTGNYSELNFCASIYGTLGQKIKKKYDFE